MSPERGSARRRRGSVAPDRSRTADPAAHRARRSGSVAPTRSRSRAPGCRAGPVLSVVHSAGGPCRRSRGSGRRVRLRRPRSRSPGSPAREPRAAALGCWDRRRTAEGAAAPRDPSPGRQTAPAPRSRRRHRRPRSDPAALRRRRATRSRIAARQARTPYPSRRLVHPTHAAGGAGSSETGPRCRGGQRVARPSRGGGPSGLPVARNHLGLASTVEAETQLHLCVRLDAPLPRTLAVGEGTALFVCGSCFHREARIDSLSFVVDGVQQPVSRHGMPRLDLFRSLHPALDPFATAGVRADEASTEDPLLHSYLSGFWGIVKIPAGTGPTCELRLRARLHGGEEVTVPLARVPVSELTPAGPAPGPHPQDGPLVAICMATYEPPLELLHAQIESIRAQTHRNWICVISEDCSSPASFAVLQAELAADPRFIVSRSSRCLGFYLNFERALALAPANAEYVALADQDDRWYPDKLEVLLGAIGDAQLVYSDARVIDGEGGVISDSYWVRRRNNHTDLLSLLVANSVTGAASLLRRDLLEHVLPFPPAQFAHFHDHWIGLVGLALGDLAFVDRPLYDYVQHRDATLGHAAANRMTAFRDRLGSLRADPRERVRMWRLHYFVDVSRLLQVAAILQLRLDGRMSATKRRALMNFARADRSLVALANLWRRGARELVGRPETLGAEWMLAYAFTWRRLLTVSARERPVRGLRLDAVPPPDLIMAPGLEISENPVVREIVEKVAPLTLAVSDAAPQRINLLIPTVDVAHFFGGYIGKFNLARRLAESGHRVRIVTVDPVGPLPGDWRGRSERVGGPGGVFGRGGGGL